jgi:bifunctional DNA-binding transcriptional regulator/antitoxin component of YhaV-PrlF toxin-antitoxin module
VEIQHELGSRKGDDLLLIKKGDNIILEKPKAVECAFHDEFEDVQQISEFSPKKLWMNKDDEVWNSYLKTGGTAVPQTT